MWLRRLSTDRIERRLPAPADGPRVVAAPVKSAQRIVALNDAAARLGLKPGMPLADARAMYPSLPVADADWEADRHLLEAVADCGVLPPERTGIVVGMGADAEVATLFRHGGGAMSTTISSSDNAGRNVASILGTEARIDIDATWYAPTSFRLLDSADQVIESYVSDVPGRGMQFQADEIERLVAAGSLAGDILPPEESVAIMQTLDTIRAQIGLRYPGE